MKWVKEHEPPKDIFEATPWQHGLVAPDLPDRYQIKERGKERLLSCLEATNITVRIERGLTVTEAEAYKAAPGTLFLDGSARAAPFIDTDAEVINLDHHEGCIRYFTLAPCEQAYVMIHKGIDLRARDWKIIANEPDLDTVLSIWVLLNHLRLTEAGSEVRARIVPLLRLQGTIDALGLELLELSGLPEGLLRSTHEQLEHLRSRELELKKGGLWETTDFLEYTCYLLRAIDALVYLPHHFEGSLQIEELARAEVLDKRLVIALRSEEGIYEVEPHLRRLYGDRLGLIVLQKNPRTYTLRRIGRLSPLSLEKVYEQLNLADPGAGSLKSGNLWGGSDEIGGSPRLTGTKLTAQQIVDICAKAAQKLTPFKQFSGLIRAVLLSASVAAAGAVVRFTPGWAGGFQSVDQVFTRNSPEFAAILLVLSLAFLSIGAAKGGRRLYGLQLPSGLDWLLTLPWAFLGALVGGARFPGALFAAQTDVPRLPWWEFCAAVVLAAAAEILFRGSVRATLFQSMGLPKRVERSVIPWPVVYSSLVYAFWAFMPAGNLTWPAAAFTCVGVLVFSAAMGIAREKSESLIPPIILHWICLAVPTLL